MSRGELSDQGNTPTSTQCGSVEFSSNFVMTCPLFNTNILRGPHSSVAPSLRYSSRLSSGCYSVDADTGQMTKPMGCDKSTQTPSPACQAIHHAQVALAQLQHLQNCGRMEIHEISQPAAMDVAPEVLIGRELRRIADEFNLVYQAPNRRRARAHRPPNNQITGLRHWISILFRR
ncbi:bcl-2-like protein 11 [Mobula hypostoma]|uniref:bcl-2-like protein 11 n=1 Tax=Mobula hypostoma TaxID=723540 RepID=UPI002FC2900B